MKKLLLTLTVVAVSALTMYGQGRVAFNNFVSGALVRVTADPLQAHAGQGAPNSLLDQNYSIQLRWAPQGTYATQAAFDAAVLGSSAASAFLPGVDAGYYDGGSVPNPVGTSMPVGAYTMQARAWYNGGNFATYDASFAALNNTGLSAFINISATASPSTPPNTLFNAFTVAAPIPEPSMFALAGLGAAALLLFRRRK
jgi:hypothetical protein